MSDERKKAKRVNRINLPLISFDARLGRMLDEYGVEFIDDERGQLEEEVSSGQATLYDWLVDHQLVEPEDD